MTKRYKQRCLYAILMKYSINDRTAKLLKIIDALDKQLNDLRPILRDMVEDGLIDEFEELAVIQKIQVAQSFVISQAHVNDKKTMEYI